MEDSIPPKLKTIIEDFEYCEGQEKIELLVQYAESLPPVPERLAENRDEFEQVHECMTPVFVQAELDGGGLHFHFDIPESSPTVRGFAAILKVGLAGETPEAVLALPGNFYSALGLERILTPQRMGGFGAIVAHVKRLAAGHLN